MELSNESRLQPTADAEVKALDDRGVIVDTRTGKCWELNSVGFAIWQLIASGKSVGETIDAVVTRYSISADTSRQDVLSFVQSLQREGLLALAPAVGNDAAVR